MFINGVSVVLCGTTQHYSGMAIAWITQVEKEHIILSLPKGSKGTEELLKCRRFSVNQLGVGQEDVAKRFGGRHCNPSDTPDVADIVATADNIPWLSHCHLSIIGELLGTTEINQQVIVTAKIVETIEGAALQPLIFKKSDYFG